MNMGNTFAGTKTGRAGAIDIESLKAGLRQLQPTRKPTKIGVLRDLLDVIEEMLKGGVTYIDIADFLTEQTGIDFMPDPLKSMLSKLRKEAQTVEQRCDSAPNNTATPPEAASAEAPRSE